MLLKVLNSHHGVVNLTGVAMERIAGVMLQHAISNNKKMALKILYRLPYIRPQPLTKTHYHQPPHLPRALGVTVSLHVQEGHVCYHSRHTHIFVAVRVSLNLQGHHLESCKAMVTGKDLRVCDSHGLQASKKERRKVRPRSLYLAFIETRTTNQHTAAYQVRFFAEKLYL